MDDFWHGFIDALKIHYFMRADPVPQTRRLPSRAVRAFDQLEIAAAAG